MVAAQIKENQKFGSIFFFRKGSKGMLSKIISIRAQKGKVNESELFTASIISANKTEENKKL